MAVLACKALARKTECRCLVSWMDGDGGDGGEAENESWL